MQDYYQLELDDMVIALNNKDVVVELLQKKLDIAIKSLQEKETMMSLLLLCSMIILGVIFQPLQ